MFLICSRSDYVRNPRESFVAQDDELIFSDDILASATSNAKKSSASEQVNVKLEFPGNEYERPKRSQLAKGEFQTCILFKSFGRGTPQSQIPNALSRSKKTAML